MSEMYIDSDGNKRWRNEYGQLHRLDGPAVEWADGEKEWWVNGDWCTNFKDFQKAAKLTDNQITILKLKYGEI
jgi:hypothetical protein